MTVAREDGHLHVEVADDGVGGADPAKGTGLLGLADRLEVLGGALDVHSPAGGGDAHPRPPPARAPEP